MGAWRYKAFRTYQRLPEGLKRAVGRASRVLPERLRFGSDHVKWLRFALDSQHWSPQRLRDYQLARFRDIVAHAYEHVPFYRRTMEQRDIHPSQIDSLEVVQRFPIIDKAFVRGIRDDFIATNLTDRDRLPTVSGGSTGSPFHFFWSIETHAIERAFLRLIWSWSGYKVGQPVLRLRSVYKADRPSTYDAAQNWLEFTPTVLTDDFFRALADVAREFRPYVLMGYPSLVYGAACGVQKLNLASAFKSVRVCLCGSEKVYQFQRDKIAEVFGCSLSDWYGMGELVALFGWCPTCQCYHDVLPHSLTETLDAEGNPVTADGEMANVVGTAFYNRAFPFIRYRMDDLVTIQVQPSRCGLAFPCIKEIQGRCGDFVVTPSGNFVGPTGLSFALRYVKNVKDIQLYQEERNRLIVRLVPDQDYRDADGQRFVQGILERLGEPMEISIELRDQIDRIPSMKKRFVVSSVGQEALAGGLH